MPNTLDANGLLTKTRAELIAEFTADFQAIYGADINLDSDTPDGQMMNIYVQGYLDLLDFVTQVYNSFDPNNAIGRTLDSRVAINGIERQAGTFTITNVTIVSTEALNIYGRDQSLEEVFTVSDDAGNEFELITSQVIAGAGTNVYSFQAKEPGEVLTIPNTITNAVTVVLGIASVNNPTTYTTLGIDEESDTDLKLRRQKSVTLASQGFLPGLRALLQNIDGVSGAEVYENDTAAVDADGTTEHTIWAVLEGSGADADIADAIYRKRSQGVRTRGETSYTITQVDGTSFVVRWDTVITENVFVVMSISSVDGINDPNLNAIESGLAAVLNTAVETSVDSNIVGTQVKTLDENSLVNSVILTTGKEQVFTLDAAPTSGLFKFSFNEVETVDINWNDDAATIQTKVRGIAGLEAALVTGSFAGQEITIDISDLASVDYLFVVTDKTLDANLTLGFGTETLIKPTSKRNKLIFQETGIISLDIVTSPNVLTIANNTDRQFASYGGYGDLVYSLEVDASGASITTAGLYSAGGVTGIDTIRVTDELGNFKSTLVTVV